MKVTLNAIDYEMVEEYKDGFDLEALKERYTSYFEEYDYILGDWAYGKLRLKGFCEANNKLCNPINDYSKVKEYILNHCAYECKYFILKKIEKKKDV